MCSPRPALISDVPEPDGYVRVSARVPAALIERINVARGAKPLREAVRLLLVAAFSRPDARDAVKRARPPRGPTRLIDVRLPASTAAAIDGIASELGCTRSDVIVRALAASLGFSR